MSTLPSEAHDLLAFWRAAGRERWFRKDDAFDAGFRERFLALHERAARGELDDWTATPEGTLALLLLLDQFPRNAFRNTPRMYATDPKAAAIAREAVAQEKHREVEQDLRGFMILPLMHSEDAQDHEVCVRETGRDGGEQHRYALHHQDIIRRFGRFPHRNALLRRASTPEEEQFLAEGGFQG